uniref:Dynein axonemal light chain 1 n=1 Tax=Chlamydomonas euryale TaxID=1486919 RepID=A0A7R9VGL9_9CHLO|mmetsp:Transcript_34453/g.102336  ORF Transcript_34453/g.102336 Transcript_34453/m.102336 type:complete len:202 (+) Transcript_34453:148-753(+)
MAKGLSIKDAIKIFEAKKSAETGNPVIAAEAVKVELNGMCPAIEKMDATLSTLKACEHLSLSTNCIEKLSSLSGMENLKILSVGRNLIKKIENLDAVADTLEELWISYNAITSLGGVEKLANLRVLFISNNKIASMSEVEKLAGLASLEDLLLVGNPLYNEAKDAGTLAEYRIEVIKRVPQLKKLDGIPVDVDERDAAAAS